MHQHHPQPHWPINVTTERLQLLHPKFRLKHGHHLFWSAWVQQNGFSLQSRDQILLRFYAKQSPEILVCRLHRRPILFKFTSMRTSSGCLCSGFISRWLYYNEAIKTERKGNVWFKSFLLYVIVLPHRKREQDESQLLTETAKQRQREELEQVNRA